VGQKNTPLTQSVAGLSERFAARRALAIPKWAKRRQNFRDSSRQGYASDLGYVANFSDNVRVVCSDVRHFLQAMRCCEAFVLMGIIVKSYIEL
jgi:hypothetical protein